MSKDLACNEMLMFECDISQSLCASIVLSLDQADQGPFLISSNQGLICLCHPTVIAKQIRNDDILYKGRMTYYMKDIISLSFQNGNSSRVRWSIIQTNG